MDHTSAIIRLKLKGIRNIAMWADSDLSRPLKDLCDCVESLLDRIITLESAQAQEAPKNGAT